MTYAINCVPNLININSTVASNMRKGNEMGIICLLVIMSGVLKCLWGIFCYIISRIWTLFWREICTVNIPWLHLSSKWGPGLLGRLLLRLQTDLSQTAGRKLCGFNIFFSFPQAQALLVVRKRISLWIQMTSFHFFWVSQMLCPFFRIFRLKWQP